MKGKEGYLYIATGGYKWGSTTMPYGVLRLIMFQIVAAVSVENVSVLTTPSPSSNY